MTTRTDMGSLIVWSEGVRGGRPRIAGTEVTVRRIVGWDKLGFTPEEIADRVGHFSLSHVHAALAYYHANHDEIEADIATEDAEATALEQEHLHRRGMGAGPSVCILPKIQYGQCLGPRVTGTWRR